MKIRFYLKKNDINKSGECPIRADINIRGTRLQKLIGYTCSADKWGDVKEQVKHGAINKEGKDYRVINSRITDIRTHFTTYDLTLDDKPTSEAMLKEFQKVMNKNAAKIAAISSKDSEEVIEKKVAAAEEKEPKVKIKPAVDYMDEFINEESRIKEWSMETRKMVKSLKNHLNKFKKNVGLDFYDQNGIDKFINYLRSTAGLEESSAEKVYKNLAWFLRWAIRKKYTQVRDIESYEPVFKTAKKKTSSSSRRTNWTKSSILRFPRPAPSSSSTIVWTDSALYKKYGLTKDEIAYIESMIVPMDSSALFDSEDLIDPNWGEFNLLEHGVKVGDTIIYTPAGMELTVAEGNMVEYGGEKYTLAQFTAKYMPRNKRSVSGVCQGPRYFSYNGVSLYKLKESFLGGQES